MKKILSWQWLLRGLKQSDHLPDFPFLEEPLFHLLDRHKQVQLSLQLLVFELLPQVQLELLEPLVVLVLGPFGTTGISVTLGV